MAEPPLPPMDEDAAAALLGVSKTASDEEVKSAFRRLAKHVHPDLVPGHDGTTEVADLAQLTRARDALVGARSRLPWLR